MSKTGLRPPSIITLILLTGLSTLSLNMFLPSLSNIAATFKADYAVVGLAVAGYLGMTAVVQLIAGPLSDRYGRRPVLLAALVLFCLASIGCLMAGSIEVFLAFRMMQAVVISGSALSPAIVRDVMSERRAASVLGYIAMAMAVAPMLGPVAGGLLDELFGWRSSFAVFTAFGAILLIVCLVNLRETNITGSSGLAAQFKSYPALIGSRRFWGYSLCMAFSTGAFYAFLAGVPLVATVLFAMSSGTLGLYIGSITAGFFTGSFLAGRFADRYPLTTVMIAGRVIACIGPVMGITLLAADIVHPVALFGTTIWVGVGNGLTMPGATSGAMSVRPELAGSASGLAGALTVAGGGLLTYAAGELLTQYPNGELLLAIMLACSVCGLMAAAFVRRIDRLEQAGAP